jgi:hypothetical protein
MTLESLGNELAKLLADITHSLVSSKLEKMAERNGAARRTAGARPHRSGCEARRPSHRSATSPNS